MQPGDFASRTSHRAAEHRRHNPLFQYALLAGAPIMGIEQAASQTSFD
jgi:hypothetical protein